MVLPHGAVDLFDPTADELQGDGFSSAVLLSRESGEQNGLPQNLSVVGVVIEVKRRRQPVVITHHFCIVGRIQSVLRGVEIVADIVANRVPARERKSVAGDDIAWPG